MKFLTIICCLTAATCMQAQGVCTIQGTLDRDTLCHTPVKMTKIYLSALNEYDQLVPVDSTQVKKGKFSFKHTLTKEEPVLLYFLTGFDNGNVPLFVEPGEVQVGIRDAAYPNGSSVTGTPTNELYNRYQAIGQHSVQEQLDSLSILRRQMGDEWLDTPAGMERRMRIGAAALMVCTAERIRFLVEHNDSPLAPLMMERELLYNMSQRYAKNLLSALSPDLARHPYYRSFANAVHAQDLKVRGELPDITLPLADGSRIALADLRGKYVLLDFWASWCGPCRREIPFLKQLYEETAEQREKFVIVSFSLDNKEKAWRDAIQSHGIGQAEWMHASDLLGWGSPAARMMGVTAIPKTILIDPEGRAVSFTLRGEEMVKRVKQILGGDLYYQK